MLNYGRCRLASIIFIAASLRVGQEVMMAGRQADVVSLLVVGLPARAAATCRAS